MTWGEWFNTAAGAASLFSVILAAILGTVTWLQNRATNKLITDGRDGTQQLIKATGDSTQALLKEMQTTTQTTLGQLGQVLDRMDRAAEQRDQDRKDRLDDEEGPRC